MSTTEKLDQEYINQIAKCEKIFKEKALEYGATWAIYRWSSLTDQLWMKIKRIRKIEESNSRIPDPVDVEYIALINYAIIFLMRLSNTNVFDTSETILENIHLLENYSDNKIMDLYHLTVDEAFNLYRDKNHDYNNAWQDMSIFSITDLIIVKVLRMKHIVNGKPDVQFSDVDQQLFDIINYSIFALIKLTNKDELMGNGIETSSIPK